MNQRLGFLTWALLAVGCGSGGGSPTAPRAPDTPAFNAVVTIASGETDRPVAGATALAGSQSCVTDAAGRCTLVSITDRTLIIETPGFLRRKTLLRGGPEERVTLWPADPSRGLSQDYTSTIVYSSALALLRFAPEVTRVTILPSAEYVADPLGLAVHEHAAERLTAALEGRITFVVASQASDGYTIISDLSDSPCDQTAYDGCAMRLVRPGAEIIGGSVTLKRGLLRAGWFTTILHEMGHILGLSHNDDGDPRDVMSSQPLRFSVRDFSPREKVTLRMMYQRRPSNFFPDSDPDVRTTSGLRSTSQPVFCTLGH
jgi:hypothetical protein